MANKEEKLLVSPAPHLRSGEETSKIMWTVVACLLPAVVAGTWFFGIYALRVILVAASSAILTEAILQKTTGRKVTINDGSAVVTGLLLALIIPPAVPLWLPVVGAATAIGISKFVFGGLGQNIFNPALVGRAVLLASWPGHMTTWMRPRSILLGLDGLTGATPLALLKEEGMEELLGYFGSKVALYKCLFLGQVGGSIGETSALALLLGAIFLLYKRYIDWRVPLGFIGTVAFLTWVLGGAHDPLFHILAGGLILGAFYMATDMVTTPIGSKGRMIFAIGAGALVVLIRLKGGYPEGVCYSILLMNGLTPLIDRWIKPRRYGT